MVGQDRGLTLERALYYSIRLVAQVAQNVLLAALFVLAGTSSHAAIGLSSLFVAMLAPALIFGLLGGAIVDRIGPARGLALGAVLRFSVVALAAAFVHGPSVIWVISFAYAAVSQVFSPAEMALVRTLRKDAPGQAHSLLVALQYVGQGLGFAVVAPALWYVGGANAMLGGATVGFLMLATLSLLLAGRLHNATPAEVLPARGAFSFRDTVRFFRGESLARDAVAVLAVKAVVSQGIVVALPLYLSHDLGLGRSALVYLLLPGIAGMAAGLAWAAPAITKARAAWFMRAGLLGLTVGVFALAALDYGLIAMFEYSQLGVLVDFDVSLNTTFVVALPVAFLIGVSLSLSQVAARVALTETAPMGQQARVFAVQSTLTESLIVLPLLVMGVGTQYAGARPTLAAIGVLAALAFLVIHHPRFQPGNGPTHGRVLEPVPIPVYIED
ncbi:MAG: MFS transporter [Tepidiformaceae bacterium]